MYKNHIKRCMDFLLALFSLIVLSPILLALTLIGFIVMNGNPFFVQQRPGKDEKIFSLIKFRTMTNRRDKNGVLLPDEQRLTPYGRFLRSTSLDELPELLNIISGKMAVVGPRPQLVADMLFMTDTQRRRHSVRPGLTGLAQCSGRNNMSWEKKFEYDLKYIEKITFVGDIKIIFKTVFKVFARDGINEDGMATAEDLGDYLLHNGKIDESDYEARLMRAKELLEV